MLKSRKILLNEFIDMSKNITINNEKTLNFSIETFKYLFEIIVTKREINEYVINVP